PRQDGTGQCVSTGAGVQLGRERSFHLGEPVESSAIGERLLATCFAKCEDTAVSARDQQAPPQGVLDNTSKCRAPVSGLASGCEPDRLAIYRRTAPNVRLCGLREPVHRVQHRRKRLPTDNARRVRTTGNLYSLGVDARGIRQGGLEA